MEYREIVKAIFIKRPNRFIAEVEINGDPVTVHIKNTGRCRELLVEDAIVYLAKGEGAKRKTPYDLVAVEKNTKSGKILINMDSFAPNLAAFEWLKGGLFSENARVYPERTYKGSRFDFYVEDGDRRAFVEIKGVTLEEDGVLSFPDAPTERGIKHLSELCEAKREGYEAYIIFVIQMEKAEYFKPNDKIDKSFGNALRKAYDEGVGVLAFTCHVTEDSMIIGEPCPVYLEKEGK